MRIALGALEALILGLVAYNLVVALFGWGDPPPHRPGTRRRRFRVVVPAHNEEAVLRRLLEDLKGQVYPGGLEVWVLADRCTDRTAGIARESGARVAERTEGPDGKGAALSWYLDTHPLDDNEALVVLDADNRVPTDLLGRFADELEVGHGALQAYLDVANPDASPVATASALSYWASNRMVQLARRRLGWPADLGGTGMCVDAAALMASGGFGTGLAEDQELGVRLFLAGYPVVWLHDVRIRDEKPSSAAVVVRQRSRWAQGRRSVSRSYLWKLLKQGRPAAIDLALRLIQPSRMGVALASAGLAVASALGVPLLAWPLWAGVAAVQVLAPLPFLVKEGVEARYLVRYPVLVFLPLLKIPARLRRERSWYHTPHGGSG